MSEQKKITTSDSSSGELNLSTRVANLFINRVSLSEVLNIISDLCKKRAQEIIDDPSSEIYKKVMRDLHEFESESNKQEGQEVPSNSTSEEVTPIDTQSATTSVSGPMAGFQSSGPAISI